jgi:hypothetical protein
MTDDKIKDLLQKADQMAGRPVIFPVDIYAIYRRAHIRRIAKIATRIAALFVFISALAIWSLLSRNAKSPTNHEQIASVKTQLMQLDARVDATLKLVNEVLEEERKQHRLNELEAQLASIPDPLEEVQMQVDKTAFILVYQADRMYREFNLKGSAVKTYKRVIKLFPKTQWAEVARQRLAEMKNQKLDGTDSKGELLWNLQNMPSSC